jgi:hypothetical protein
LQISRRRPRITRAARRLTSSTSLRNQASAPPVPDWLQNADQEALVTITAEEQVALEEQINNLRTPVVPSAQETIDTLAYYVPFHFDRSRWGIYSKASGIVHVAVALKAGPVASVDKSVLELSRKILFEHEFFHFAAEIACSRAEVVARNHCTIAISSTAMRHPHEEALANSHAYTKALAGQVPALKSAVATWMTNLAVIAISGTGLPVSVLSMDVVAQPIHATACFGTADISLGWASRVSVLYAAKIVGATRILLDLESLRILKPFPKFEGMRVIVHTNDHPPPHFHVERPPGQDITRYLWPEVKPYPGDKQLSASEEKDLRGYLDRFGEKIGQKIQVVYSAVLKKAGRVPSERHSRPHPI